MKTIHLLTHLGLLIYPRTDTSEHMDYPLFYYCLWNTLTIWFLSSLSLHSGVSFVDFAFSKLMFPDTQLPASCLKSRAQFKVEINGTSWAQLLRLSSCHSLDYLPTAAHFPILFTVINTHMFFSAIANVL